MDGLAFSFNPFVFTAHNQHASLSWRDELYLPVSVSVDKFVLDYFKKTGIAFPRFHSTDKLAPRISLLVAIAGDDRRLDRFQAEQRDFVVGS